MRDFFAEYFGKAIAEIFVFLIFLVLLPIKLVVITVSFLHKKIKQVWIAGPKYSLDQGKGFVLGLPVASKSLLDRFSWKKALIIGGILIVTNFLVIAWLNWPTTSSAPAIKRLYLLDEAGQYIANVEEFELKVKDVSRSLDIPPEWLMAVMYSESRFNPSVLNHRGSGATGLIQFMVPAVKDLNRRLGTSFYMSDIKRMSAIDQLDLVREYLQTMRERYGEYDSLTDLYLAILYPRAMENGQDYVLYAKPSKKYAQNIGLDEDHNGSVSVSDIDNRMKRVFPEAYMVEK